MQILFLGGTVMALAGAVIYLSYVVTEYRY